jgi:hypothetical protein
MAPAAQDPAAGGDSKRSRGWPLAGLVLMLLLGAFPALSSILDLLADSRTGLPSDHTGTFTAVAGTSWSQAQASTPGTARYITLLERGYAVHELTFALLLLLIVAIPFRRRQPWAWWAAWIPMIANLGYTLTFGAHDHTILIRSLIVDFALPVLLLAHIPLFFNADRGTRRSDVARPG